MGFKGQLLLSALPAADDIISVCTDPGDADMVCPDFAGSDSDYILLAGVDENALSKRISEADKRSDALADFFRSAFPSRSWEVREKPVVLVESPNDALAFTELMTALGEEEQAEILSDIQLFLNEAWGRARPLTPELWRRLSELALNRETSAE